MANWSQHEMNTIMRGINALESIAEELRAIRELKTQELKELEKKTNALHSMYMQKVQELNKKSEKQSE